jgi:hypothetical protein
LETVDPLAAGDCGSVHIFGDGTGVQSSVSGEVKSAVAQPLDLAGTCVLHGAAAKGATAAARVQNTNNKSVGEEVVHIVEHKVYVVLSDEGDKDLWHWVLDTRASNHMMGSRAAFANIDAKTTRTMRFGDESVMRIEGRDTILYQCKNGKHRALPNVYYIPRLDTNIISIGQLDESDYEVKIHCGVMQIRAEDGRLLTRIRRGPTRLYTLDLHITQPVCLAARVGEEAWRWHARYGHVNFTALRKMATTAL